MFDHYEIGRSPSSINVTVEEKRAPTDESVRLLREMEEKIQKSLVQSIRVENTEFNCVVHVFEDLMSSQFRLMAVFKLNGKQERAEYRTNTWQFSPEEAITRLRDAVATKIANLIAGSFSKEQVQQLRMAGK